MGVLMSSSLCCSVDFDWTKVFFRLASNRVGECGPNQTGSDLRRMRYVLNINHSRRQGLIEAGRAEQHCLRLNRRVREVEEV